MTAAAKTRHPRTLESELEDHLITFNFHTNGFDPTGQQPSMLGTYMGVLHYDRIKAAVAAKFTRDEWLVGCDVWEYDHESTGSPTFKLLALWVRRILDENKDDNQTPA